MAYKKYCIISFFMLIESMIVKPLVKIFLHGAFGYANTAPFTNAQIDHTVKWWEMVASKVYEHLEPDQINVPQADFGKILRRSLEASAADISAANIYLDKAKQQRVTITRHDQDYESQPYLTVESRLKFGGREFLMGESKLPVMYDFEMFLNSTGGVVVVSNNLITSEQRLDHVFQDPKVDHKPYLHVEDVDALPSIHARLRAVRISETKKAFEASDDLLDMPVTMVFIPADIEEIAADIIDNFDPSQIVYGGYITESSLVALFSQSSAQREEGVYSYQYKAHPNVRVIVNDGQARDVYTADKDYQYGNGVHNFMKKGDAFTVEGGSIIFQPKAMKPIPVEKYKPLQADLAHFDVF